MVNKKKNGAKGCGAKEKKKESELAAVRDHMIAAAAAPAASHCNCSRWPGIHAARAPSPAPAIIPIPRSSALVARRRSNPPSCFAALPTRCGFWFPCRQSPAGKDVKERRRSLVVQSSLFGVGAPEALVIGVVALLVFGPKGLAEMARNLGKALRAFQPTIRELQEVSMEFKTSLEREIGFDEVSSSVNSRPSASVNENQQLAPDPNGATRTMSYPKIELPKATTQEQPAAPATPLAANSAEEQQAEPAAETGSPPAAASSDIAASSATTADPVVANGATFQE